MLLQTKRLILRPLVAGDADWITTGISEPDVHRWLTAVPRPYSWADAEHFLAKRSGDPTALALVWGGAGVGVITLTDGRDETGLPELGYWLAKPAWGQGLMTEAAQAVTAKHFRAGGDTLGSGWIEGNEASGRVLVKTGFKPTGQTVARLSKYFGHEVPVVRVALTPDRWRSLETHSNQR